MGEEGGRRLQSSYITRTGSGTPTEELAIDRLIASPAVVFMQMCISFFFFGFHGVRMPSLSHVSRVVCAVPWCECWNMWLFCPCPGVVMHGESVWMSVCAHLRTSWLFSLTHCEGKDPSVDLILFFFPIFWGISAHFFSGCFVNGWIKLLFFFFSLFPFLRWTDVFVKDSGISNIGPVFVG